jgi:hypothetical protein
MTAPAWVDYLVADEDPKATKEAVKVGLEPFFVRKARPNHYLICVRDQFPGNENYTEQGDFGFLMVAQIQADALAHQQQARSVFVFDDTGMIRYHTNSLTASRLQQLRPR